MIEQLMHRRLDESQSTQSQKRYKTADTRISNSRKLPRDFFSSNKSVSALQTLTISKNQTSLPYLRPIYQKSKSTQQSSAVLTQKCQNFQITFRPSQKDEKWKMPVLGQIGKKKEPEKIKRISRTKAHLDAIFSANVQNMTP